MFSHKSLKSPDTLCASVDSLRLALAIVRDKLDVAFDYYLPRKHLDTS